MYKEINISTLGGMSLGNPGAAAVILPAVIQGIATLVPIFVQIFGGGKKDQWSSMSWSQKHEFVRQGLIVATSAVLQGKANSVEEVMQTLIAQVELDESWSKWKRLNPDFYGMIQEAQQEVNTAKSGNLNYSYKYIPPVVLQSYRKALQKAALFNFNSPVTLMVIGSLTLLGFAYYKYRQKNEQRRLENV